MKSIFVKPRFTGTRFSEASLPLELARDLMAYQELVREVARHLYLDEHPTRKKLPKKFASNFSLHIDSIEEGSTIPKLARVLAAGALSFSSLGDDYLTRARDLVAECIHCADATLPDKFPKHLLEHFNRIGASLQKGEAMELTTAEGKAAALTPVRREKLVQASVKEFKRNIEVQGKVEAVNWKDSTFTIRDLDGRVVTAPMPSEFRKKAGEYGGRNRCLIKFKAIGVFDSFGKLVKVESTDEVFVQPNYMIADLFKKLRELDDGWYDGQGRAPDKNKLLFLEAEMVEHYPEEIPSPNITPTPDGNLLLEWNVDGDPSLDIDLTSLTAQYHAFLPGDSEVEREFDLSARPNWKGFLNFLIKNIRAR